jgi:hypothetical protein
MKKSTIAVISALTMVVFHGAHHFFGWVGVAGVIAAVAVFFLVARALYWRQLRKLRKATSGLPYEDRKLVYTEAGLDGDARRDIEGLAKQERKPR